MNVSPSHRVTEKPHDAPLVVSLGLGIDSVAMLVRLRKERIRVDAVLFADTGGEKPETYAYLDVINPWLSQQGMPQVEVVSYRQNHGRYDTLAGNCIANSMLPSLAYGGRGCSGKFKIEVMDSHVLGAKRGLWKGDGMPLAQQARARGLPIYRAIGYNAGPKDSRRSNIADDAHFRFVYPLREFGLDRIACIKEIIGAGLPVPIKSACTFCPASKPAELIWLHAVHPDLFMQALLIEQTAMPKLTAVEGMWRKATKTRPGSWIAWALSEGLVQRGPADELVLVPHQGVPPRHPDEILADQIRADMSLAA